MTNNPSVTLDLEGGTSAGTNTLGYVQLFSSPVQENVKIVGDHNLTIGTVAHGAIAAVNTAAGTTLATNGLIITDTDLGVVRLISEAPGIGALAPLAFKAAGDNLTGIIPVYGCSTNAVQIDAHASGGLITQAGDANFTYASDIVQLTGVSFHPLSRMLALASTSLPSKNEQLGASPSYSAGLI